MTALTHDELCDIAVRFLQRNGYKVAFSDRFRAVTRTGELPDAIGFRNSLSCLIEAKTSRADFLADRKKPFRANPDLGMGDWRFYICEPGVIEVDDLPPGWGLLHVKGGKVHKVHGWPTNGQLKHKPFKANKDSEMSCMYSALRRMQVRGHLDEVYGGIPKGAKL